MRVAIGLVLAAGFPVPTAFVMSWTRMMQTVLTGAGNALLPPERQVTEMNVIYSHAFPVDHARNEVCRLFLDKDTASDYLLFLDADMTHPPDTPHRLVAHGLDVVTGRYVMRRPPFFSVAMRRVGPGPTELQAIEKLVEPEKCTGLMPIDGGGAGCLLISRRALTDVRALVGEDWFRYGDGPAGLRSRSEDMWFYEQALRAGHQPWLDADLHCGHERREIVTPADHLPYAESWRRAMAQQEVQA